MAITIQQTPATPFDQAYGPNPVTLSGVPVDPVTGVPQAEKYVLQVWINGGLVADIRQTPNSSLRAIYDIQNIVQNHVAPSKNDIEEIGLVGDPLRNAAYESVEYELRATVETGGTIPAYPGDPGEWDTVSSLLDFGGRKEYWQVPYDNLKFLPELSTDGLPTNCTLVDVYAQPFSSVEPTITGASITDGKPSWLTSNMEVAVRNVTTTDMTTISYYNGLGPASAGPLQAQGIEAFVFYQYNGNVLVSTDIIYNQQSNGGGPNISLGQGIIPSYPYNAISVGTGPANFPAFVPGTTHYYVAAAPWSSVSCPTLYPNIADDSMFWPQRFNIVDADCNDYPHFQFSWLNKYGFRDYYTFKKRKDRSINIKRNNYLREANDYAGTEYDVKVYDRGMTTYSQTLEQVFTAFTDFLEDSDTYYLEELFTSPDVKVRFDAKGGAGKYEWVPVTLLSTAWTEKTTRKNKLFQYDIKFKIAHNIKSQRG